MKDLTLGRVHNSPEKRYRLRYPAPDTAPAQLQLPTLRQGIHRLPIHYKVSSTDKSAHSPEGFAHWYSLEGISDKVFATVTISCMHPLLFTTPSLSHQWFAISFRTTYNSMSNRSLCKRERGGTKHCARRTDDFLSQNVLPQKETAISH